MGDGATPLERFASLQSAARELPRPCALLVRHSIRGPIPKDPELRDVPLRPEGRALAATLGAACDLVFERALSSPMRRCADTATEFLTAAAPHSAAPALRSSSVLGAPGAFVRDAELAWGDYMRWRKHELVRKLHSQPDALRGYEPQAVGVTSLFDLLLGPSAQGLTFACTHDILMSATLSWLANCPWPDSAWPDFHEGLWLWREGARGCAWYRGRLFSRALARG